MKTPRADYTLEFEKEAVRLVQGGQRQSEAAAALGVAGQTPGNWIKADAAGARPGARPRRRRATGDERSAG